MILDGFRVLSEIADERRRQDELWGGSYHDDEHGEYEWIDIIDHYVDQARFATRSPAKDYRTELVKVAALAVAAIESYDRKQKGDQ
jgi:hypothetical protein